MKIIEITQGQVTYVDDDRYEELNKYSWHLTAQGYAARRKTITTSISTIVTMHEEVLGKRTIRGHIVIDHKNHNKLDNQIDNLRLVTHQENIMNRPKKARGVGYDKLHGKWKAYHDHITMGQPKRRVNLGTFAKEEDALECVAAYRESLK